MAEDAAVRHRDKRVSRGMAIILGVPALFTWFMAVFVAFTNATSDKPVPAAALPFVVGAMGLLGVMFAFLSLSFAVLRTVVTDEAVIVKYGLFGPEIDLASITACKVLDYEWTRFGGWGIRRGLGGVWAYVPGPGKVVELEYREDGETKRVQIGAADAPKLAQEIDRARQARARRRVEIDAPGAEAAAADEEAALAETAEERAARKRR
jgi:hypothetical protein